jgi:rod shape-determining protein MreB
MIVDVGAGTTEAAVISLGGVCNYRTLRVAGDEMDEALIAYMRREQGLLIGERSAEELKKEIGSAFALEQELRAEVRGRDLRTGLPRTAVVASEQVRVAIAEPLQSIVDVVRETMETTAPELAADIVKNGICLCGGGALLRGMDRLLWSALGVPVYVPKEPMNCVVMGTGKFLERTDSRGDTHGTRPFR